MSTLSDKDLYNKIVNLRSLKPSKVTNKAFTELVAFSLNPLSTSSLSKLQVSNLQKICSQSEYELEKYWSNKILKSNDPSHFIKEFPYYGNYQKLTQMEWYSLLSCTAHDAHNILFIGGGPLPLTAIILATNYVDKVSVLEKDEEAYDISCKLVNKLHINDKVNIIKADGVDYKHYSEYNVIVVAALAGIQKNVKRQILQKIKDNSKQNTHILARSSWGMREILYRPLEKDLYKIFDPIVEVRPQNDVVNSVVIFSNTQK